MAVEIGGRGRAWGCRGSSDPKLAPSEARKHCQGKFFWNKTVDNLVREQSRILLLVLKSKNG